ncbi:response regulator [Runella sp.]|uniref:response regulator n=1 Tax=Runella sp. TaxID=1960881 RepID=UPI003D0F6038
MILRPTKILLIDDHLIFNNGLKLLLDEQPDWKVCGQVFHPKDVFFSIQEQNPDLVVLDINLQGINGIELGKKAVSNFPNLKVIILTMYNQSKLLEEARKAGLHGYMLKDATTPELLTGLRAVLGGKTYFDRKVADWEQTPDDPFGDDFARKLNLTFRELEIIQLVKEGLNNEQMAERLGVSFFTIKTHRKNIHFKLGINNVAELIQFAIKHGV